MVTLKDHLVEILRSRDFEVDEKDGYVYGRREDISVVVMAAGDMLMDDAHDFVRNVSGFPGRKVVASLTSADEGVQAFLQKNGVHYWGREEIEHEVGSLQLETLADGKGRSLLDEVISDESPQRPFEPPEQSIPIIVESTSDKTERIVKPNFTLDDMKHIARHEVQGYRFDLELVPHYLFHYVLDLGGGKQRAGIVAVNALTGQVETWRWGFELVDTIDIVHSKREPKMDEDKAKAAAVKSIEEEARSMLETVKDFGHSEIIERKKGARDTMPIEGKGLVYLPVWCIEGKGGAMIVNSSSGKIISEHMHGSEARLG